MQHQKIVIFTSQSRQLLTLRKCYCYGVSLTPSECVQICVNSVSSCDLQILEPECVDSSMELKLSMGVVDGLTGLRAYFRSDLTEGQISSRGQVALKMPYGNQTWYEKPLTNE